MSLLTLDSRVIVLSCLTLVRRCFMLMINVCQHVTRESMFWTDLDYHSCSD